MPFREIDHSEYAGIEKTMIYDTDSKGIYIRVVDHETEEETLFNPRADQVLDAFQHPFAYISFEPGSVILEPSEIARVSRGF